jgi:spore maturation protein CgeB
MKILYYGPGKENSLSRFAALRVHGHECRLVDPGYVLNMAPRLVRSVERRLKNGLFIFLLNRLLARQALKWQPDVVWIEKGIVIYPSTLRRIRNGVHSTLVASHSDDFLDSYTHKVSRHFMACIPLYDIIFTPRDVNFEELYARGARRVEKFWKGFSEEVLLPQLSSADHEYYRCDTTFAGHYEPARREPLLAVAGMGVDLKLWGTGWGRSPMELRTRHMGSLLLPEYGKALSAAKISLHFLSRWARDTQDSRSFEIPAARGFMLAERTEDHLACFDEGKEAEFFNTPEEMLDKIRFYLSHECERQRVANAGHERCLRSGYSNRARVGDMLKIITEIRKTC